MNKSGVFFIKKLLLFVFAVILAALCFCLGACSGNQSADIPSVPDSGIQEPEWEEPDDTGNSDAPDDTSDTGDIVDADSRPILGVWWWSDKLGDEYLDFAADNGVTEIYFCSSKFNDGTDEFIAKANAKDIDVFWLAGEYQWVENNESLFKQIDKYIKYQESYEHTFSGIHFDIEPHQHPQFKSRRQELLTMFAELTYTLKKRYPQLYIEYDIPFWLNDEITLRGAKKPAYEHIIDNASRVTLMSYRDTAEKIYSVGEDELKYALSVGKTVNFGVETKSNEGDQVSFMEEGREYMYKELARLRSMIPTDCGIVIHQVAQWYDLKD